MVIYSTPDVKLLVPMSNYFSGIAPVVNHSSHFLFKYSRLDRSDWYCLDLNTESMNKSFTFRYNNITAPTKTKQQNPMAKHHGVLFVCLFCLFGWFVYSVSRISEGNESCWKTSRRRCGAFEIIQNDPRVL